MHGIFFCLYTVWPQRSSLNILKTEIPENTSASRPRWTPWRGRGIGTVIWYPLLKRGFAVWTSAQTFGVRSQRSFPSSAAEAGPEIRRWDADARDPRVLHPQTVGIVGKWGSGVWDRSEMEHRMLRISSRIRACFKVKRHDNPSKLTRTSNYDRDEWNLGVLWDRSENWSILMFWENMAVVGS